MADDLHKALSRFLKSSQNTKIQEVRVVIHDPEFFDKFSKMFGQLTKGKYFISLEELSSTFSSS